MKKIVSAFLLSLLLSGPAYAATAAELMGLGMPSALATELATEAIPSDVVPSADNTHSLGTSSMSWKNIYWTNGTVDGVMGSTGGVLSVGTTSGAAFGLLRNNTVEVQLEGNSVINYTTGTAMGTSSVDPATHTGTDDWLQIQIEGTNYYIPVYAAS